VLDDGQVHSRRFGEVGNQFEGHVAKAHDDPRVAERGAIEDVGAGPEGDLRDSGQIR